MIHLLIGIFVFLLLALFKVLGFSFQMITEFFDGLSEKKNLHKAIKLSPSFQCYMVGHPELAKSVFNFPYKADGDLSFLCVDEERITYYDHNFMHFDIDKEISLNEVSSKLQRAIDKSPSFQNALDKYQDLKKYYQKHHDGGIRIFVIENKIWAYINGKFISYQIGDNFRKTEMARTLSEAIEKTPTFQQYLDFDIDVKTHLQNCPDGGFIDLPQKKLEYSMDQIIYVTIKDKKIYLFRYGNEYRFIIGR